MKRKLPFFILLLSLISCNSLTPEENEIKTTLGKSLDTGMFSFVHEGNRTMTYDEFRAVYRHISIVYLEDGCRPCYPRYVEWQTRMDTLALEKDYTVLFIIRGQSYDKFLANLLQTFPEYDLFNDQFHVVMDDNSLFLTNNSDIPRWILDKSLLMDGEGTIRLIGHPFSSPRMLELFNDIIDILDYREMKLELIERKIFHHRKWETAGRGANPSDKNRRNIFTAPRITSSDNRIFACYQNPVIDEGDDWHILTFDWNGNPLGKYSIPFDPYVITSVDDSTIYSVALTGEEYRLVKMDM